MIAEVIGTARVFVLLQRRRCGERLNLLLSECLKLLFKTVNSLLEFLDLTCGELDIVGEEIAKSLVS